MKIKLKGPKMGPFLKTGLLTCILAAILTAFCYGADRLAADILLPAIFGL